MTKTEVAISTGTYNIEGTEEVNTYVSKQGRKLPFPLAFTVHKGPTIGTGRGLNTYTSIHIYTYNIYIYIYIFNVVHNVYVCIHVDVHIYPALNLSYDYPPPLSCLVQGRLRSCNQPSCELWSKLLI